MNILEARRRTLGGHILKKTAQGNPAIATDSLARMYPGIEMQGWTEQDGAPTPEAPVPIISAGTQNQETGKWDYEITIANAQTDPDKNQTVTLTSDRPLTKWDKLEKRNGQWGWVYGSAELTLNGSENWILYRAFNGFYLKNILNGNYYRQDGFCDQFKVVTVGNSDGTNMWIGIENNAIYTTQNPFYSQGVQAWKDHLSQNPMMVIYKSNTETFIPLTTAEQEAMNALHTYRPTTVLSNQQGCQMTLTYKTREGVGGGNLLDYRKLVNPVYWIGTTPTNPYKYFDIVLKNNTKYRLSCTENNMNKNYVTEHPIGFETTFYIGENPGTFGNNVRFGHTGLNQDVTEYEFTTTDNPYYFNLYIDGGAFTPENLHIVFDELLPGLKLQEVN